MTEITTEHRGYEIRYSENEDVWRCWKLGVDAPKLSTLKTKINKLIADSNRLTPIKMIKISENEWSQSKKATEVTVTSITENGEEVWGFIVETTMWRGSLKEVKERRKFPLDQIVEDTPETRAAIEKWLDAVETKRAAEAVSRAAFKAIPRIDVEMLRAKIGTSTPDDQS